MPTKPAFKMDGVTVVAHPLVRHKLSIMRSKDTSTARFRQLLREISTLLCYEVTRDLPLEDHLGRDSRRPDHAASASRARSWSSCPSCCAGLGLVEGMLDLVLSARVGHVGLYYRESPRPWTPSNTISARPRTCPTACASSSTRCWPPPTPPSPPSSG